MEYQLKTGVWEITMACNMRCGHCGSSCAERLPDELTTDEALRLCDDLAELELKKITLSGGEPFLREDWYKIARRLSEHGVEVNVISNGWFIDARLVDLARDSGLVNIGISLDGLEHTHDAIRREGSFARVIRALHLLKKSEFPSAIVTTIMKRNLHELPQLQKVLEDQGVENWQFQIGLPMGNLSRNDIIAPSQVETIIDFAYNLLDTSPLKPFIADSVGYYTKKVTHLWETAFGPECGWKGCQAGKTNIGILHDGIILGCTSIRDDQFVEGNIRETPLREIWTRPGAFAWNRELTKDDLTGFCKKCQFGEYCLGGCGNTKLTMTGDLKENLYCAYRLMIERLFPKIERIQDVKTLLARARKAEELNLYEVAEKCLSRAIVMEPDNLEALKLFGYICFKLGDFTQCLEINQKAVKLNPADAYIQKGLGVSLAKVGQVEAGITALKKAIELSDEDFLDPYHDLAVVFLENSRPREALGILEQGRQRSVAFQEMSEKLYQTCLEAKTQMEKTENLNFS